MVGLPWVMRGHPCQTVDMWHKSRTEIERRCQCERAKFQMKMLLKFWKIYFNTVAIQIVNIILSKHVIYKKNKERRAKITVNFSF